MDIVQAAVILVLVLGLAAAVLFWGRRRQGQVGDKRGGPTAGDGREND